MLVLDDAEPGDPSSQTTPMSMSSMGKTFDLSFGSKIAASVGIR